MSRTNNRLADKWFGKLKKAWRCLRQQRDWRPASINLIIREYYWEKRLGITTNAPCVIREQLGLHNDGARYQPTPYNILERAFDYLRPAPDDVFIDLGCGQGRAVFVAATRRFKKVIGVEINQELLAIAKRNLDKLKLNVAPIEIVGADAAAFDLSAGTVFFMFNPFGPRTLVRVLDNLKKTLMTHSRKVRVVYYSAAQRALLDSQAWLVAEGEIDATEIFVWHNGNGPW
ncbi:MAG: class I SAM-dependent methyltransferase [Lentisphaerae bacterium]|nr:class I SAM-dependent methyltransferase [Lentisphaerota bacterium]